MSHFSKVTRVTSPAVVSHVSILYFPALSPRRGRDLDKGGPLLMISLKLAANGVLEGGAHA